eukprot:Platyproteum_vivax@DN8190_c0_g1_i1.p1
MHKNIGCSLPVQKRLISTVCTSKKTVPPAAVLLNQIAGKTVNKPVVVPKKPVSDAKPVTVTVSDILSEQYHSSEATGHSAIDGQFWYKYHSYGAMCQAHKKEEIVEILENVTMVKGRVPVFVKNTLKNSVLVSLDGYSCRELGPIVHNLHILDHLHDDFLLQIIPRVLATVHNADTRACHIANLMDSYASQRLYVESVIENLAIACTNKIDTFNTDQLLQMATSFARFGVQNSNFKYSKTATLVLNRLYERLLANDGIVSSKKPLKAFPVTDQAPV